MPLPASSPPYEKAATSNSRKSMVRCLLIAVCPEVFLILISSLKFSCSDGEKTSQGMTDSNIKRSRTS